MRGGGGGANQIPLCAGHHHLNGVSLAGRLWLSLECWFESFVTFSGDPDQYCLETLYCGGFSGGPGPQFPSLDPRRGHQQDGCHYFVCICGLSKLVISYIISKYELPSSSTSGPSPNMVSGQ